MLPDIKDGQIIAPILPRDTVEIRHIVRALRECKVIEGSYDRASLVPCPNGYSRDDREAMKNRLRSAARSLANDERIDKARREATEAAEKAEREAAEAERLRKEDEEAALEARIKAAVDDAVRQREAALSASHTAVVTALSREVEQLRSEMSSGPSSQMAEQMDDLRSQLEKPQAALVTVRSGYGEQIEKLNAQWKQRAKTALNKVQRESEASTDAAVEAARADERRKAIIPPDEMFGKIVDWLMSEEATPDNLMEIYSKCFAEPGNSLMEED